MGKLPNGQNSVLVEVRSCKEKVDIARRAAVVLIILVGNKESVQRKCGHVVVGQVTHAVRQNAAVTVEIRRIAPLLALFQTFHASPVSLLRL